MKRITGERTLPPQFYSKVQKSIANHPIKVGMQVEVMDKSCVSAMRLASVREVIGCRIRLVYDDPKVILLACPTYTASF